MEALIKRMFDLQFELTMVGAELDERINRLPCQPGIHEMVQSESRHLILMAANIKYDLKVLKLALNKMSSPSGNSVKDKKEALAALREIENIYYNTFKRFVFLIEKLEADPLNNIVEALVRTVWSRLGESYQEFRKTMISVECLLSDAQTGSATF